MEEVVSLIANQGFAIAMCTYVIISVNKTLGELTKAVTVLTEKIEKE